MGRGAGIARAPVGRTAAAWSLAALSGALLVAGMVLGVLSGIEPVSQSARDLPVSVGFLAFPAVGSLLAVRRPENPIGWLLLASGLGFAGAVFAGGYADYAVLGDPGSLPGGSLAAALITPSGALGTALCAVFLLLVLPDGRLPAPRWQPLAWVAALALAALLVGLLLGPGEPEAELASVDNPLEIASAARAMDVLAAVGYTVLVACFAGALVALGLRLRRGRGQERQQLAWVACAVALIALTLALHLTTAAPVELNVVATALLPVAVGIAVMRSGLLDIELLIRRSLVYGALWLVIAAAVIGVAAAFGIAAGARLPVSLAVVLAILATLIAQPVRRRLEGLAGRWVFGERPSEYEVLRRFGAVAQETFDPVELPARLAKAVREGLALRWARVSLARGSDQRRRIELAALAGTPDGTPELTMPLVHADETVGLIECGPKLDGTLGPVDRELLAGLAGQAALAVRNAGLADELAIRLAEIQRQADELTASRARIVQAQDAERRRIERDIHDGAQQGVVALLANLGLARSRLRRGALTDAGLAQLQEEARQLLGDLRELAAGIRPSVLADRGLVAAIQARASRLPIPVALECDLLNGDRFANEIEAAAYFVVAEGLTNVLKHAGATSARIALGRRDRRLLVAVSDDGLGFDSERVGGRGLTNLADRVEALGGRLSVSSRAGHGTRIAAELPIEPGPGA